MSFLSKIAFRNLAMLKGSDATDRALSRNPLSNNAELSNAIDGTTAKICQTEADSLDKAINKDIKNDFGFDFA